MNRLLLHMEMFDHVRSNVVVKQVGTWLGFCFLHTSESYCIFFSGYYKFFQPVDGYEMDFDSEEYSEGIYIHVIPVLFCWMYLTRN
jgi:hypothetical protein